MSVGATVNGHLSFYVSLLIIFKKLMVGCANGRTEPRIKETLCTQYMNFMKLHENNLAPDEY